MLCWRGAPKHPPPPARPALSSSSRRAVRGRPPTRSAKAGTPAGAWEPLTLRFPEAVQIEVADAEESHAQEALGATDRKGSGRKETNSPRLQSPQSGGLPGPGHTTTAPTSEPPPGSHSSSRPAEAWPSQSWEPPWLQWVGFSGVAFSPAWPLPAGPRDLPLAAATLQVHSLLSSPPSPKSEPEPTLFRPNECPGMFCSEARDPRPGNGMRGQCPAIGNTSGL